MNKQLVKAIIIYLIVVGIAAGILTSYFLFFNKSSSQDLYRQAVSNALGNQSEPYGTLDIDSGGFKFNGEFKGSATGETSRVKGDVSIDSEMEGLPMSLSLGMIFIDHGDTTDSYTQYKSVTSSDPASKALVDELFKPSIGQWVKATTEDEDVTTPASFEEYGPLATIDIIGVFFPLTPISGEDENKFLAAADKHGLYRVDKKIEKAQLKGVEARKLKVSIDKEALLEFEKEMDETLSEEANFVKYDTKFVDQFFGGNDTFTADLYLDPKKAEIIGIDFNVDLAEPVNTEDMGSSIDKIQTTLLVDYNRNVAIEPPKEYISEEELFQMIFGL